MDQKITFTWKVKRMNNFMDVLQGHSLSKIVKLLDLLKKQLDRIEHDVSIILENQRIEEE
jgi:hypothetical protein